MPSYIGESGSFSLMKNLNLEKVYRTIVLNAPVSRADISRLTGLNKVTVSNCIKDLLACDIVSEEGIVSAENGRPPMMLMLSRTCGIIIGLEISVISTNVIVTDLRGNILDKTVRDPKLYAPEEVVALLKKQIEECQSKYETTNGIIGIGIALPFNYNQKDTIDPSSPLAEWKDVDAQQFFDDAFPDINIEILNSAAAGTIGEIHFGSANPNDYLAYIHGNWNLNMDVYNGGETLSTVSPFAGRIGAILFNDKNKEFDDVASLKAVVNTLYPHTEKSHLELVTEIHERQKSGDTKVEEALKAVVSELAYGIYDVLRIFRPDAICVGGYLGAMLADGGYEDTLNEKLNELVGEQNNKGRRVTTSKFGIFNVGFGCISWVRDNIISYLFND